MIIEFHPDGFKLSIWVWVGQGKAISNAAMPLRPSRGWMMGPSPAYSRLLCWQLSGHLLYWKIFHFGATGVQWINCIGICLGICFFPINAFRSSNVKFSSVQFDIMCSSDLTPGAKSMVRKFGLPIKAIGKLGQQWHSRRRLMFAFQVLTDVLNWYFITYRGFVVTSHGQGSEDSTFHICDEIGMGPSWRLWKGR